MNYETGKPLQSPHIDPESLRIELIRIHHEDYHEKYGVSESGCPCCNLPSSLFDDDEDRILEISRERIRKLENFLSQPVSATKK